MLTQVVTLTQAQRFGDKKECTVRVRALKVQADIGGLSPLSSYFQKTPR